MCHTIPHAYYAMSYTNMVFLYMEQHTYSTNITHTLCWFLLLLMYCVLMLSVVTGGKVYVLDLAAKLDQCAEFLCKAKWGEVKYPAPFGRDAYPEVSHQCHSMLGKDSKNFLIFYVSYDTKLLSNWWFSHPEMLWYLVGGIYPGSR